MKLASFSVTNFRGLEHIAVQPGALTLIAGTNGSGKTSLIEALRSIFDGGHHPSNIRKGERKAEIVLTLDSGIIVTKTVTPKTSTLTVTDSEGQELPGETPKAFVEKLAAGFSFDPLGLIAAKPKDRAAFILESMPIRFEPAEIVAADPDYQGGSLDLDGLDALYKGVYEKRKAANVIQRDTEGTVKTLQAALPEQDTVNWAKAVTALEATRSGMVEELHRAETAIREDAVQEQDAVITEIDGKIEQLKAEKAEKLAEVNRRLHKALESNGATAAPELERMAGEIATAKERASAQAKAEGTRQAIEVARGKVRESYMRAEKFDKTLKALDEIKKRKLAEQPIEGIELRAGEVYVDGIPFDELNTAKQYLVAFSVAALQSGDLGLMVADRCEALEAETTWKEFAAGAKESGFQIIATRVEPGPLRVKVEA